MYVCAGSAFCDSLDGSTICTTKPVANHTRPSEEYAAVLKDGPPVGRAPSKTSYTWV